MATLKFDITQKPVNEDEFVKWMEAKFEIPNEQAKSNYKSNAAKLMKDFENHSFWKRIGEQMKEWDTEYYKEKGVHLFDKSELPTVYNKPYLSLLNKAYRKDCLNNTNFPNEPTNGWVAPKTWFDKIHDIIRTSFVVRYLDGVRFLDKKLSQVAAENGCKYTCSYEAHDDGYYAAHVAVVLELSIVDMNWNEVNCPIEVEIQITTQLQEMVKDLLHKYYEDNRRKYIPDDYKWQWDYHNEQFVPNYLGHIAHYLEGMIVEIRDKQK